MYLQGFTDKLATEHITNQFILQNRYMLYCKISGSFYADKYIVQTYTEHIISRFIIYYYTSLLSDEL